MSKKKTWTDIVYDILNEKNKPMHYLDITKEAVKRKKTKGKTPENTIVTLLLYEIKGLKVEGLRIKGKLRVDALRL